MTRWRKRIGPDGLSEMLKADVDAAPDTGTVNPFFAGAHHGGHDSATQGYCLSDRRAAYPEGAATVCIAGQKRRLTSTIRRELKRRSAIEATIGHMKTDGRFGRNFQLGHDDDAANATRVAATHKLRFILKTIAYWWPLCCFLSETA
ncbi:hypothetical protein FE840_002530 [Peteryoungia desertarenae]|uniref:Transposase n=1 Tax=Peteryoungia desertarenae TaxID=1813451 RepID=A0ABX6QIX4_9HYPH|nr:hypothetical protein FE840_002530 [Peteryoungia desertarenae]